MRLNSESTAVSPDFIWLWDDAKGIADTSFSSATHLSSLAFIFYAELQALPQRFQASLQFGLVLLHHLLQGHHAVLFVAPGFSAPHTDELHRLAEELQDFLVFGANALLLPKALPTGPGCICRITWTIMASCRLGRKLLLGKLFRR